MKTSEARLGRVLVVNLDDGDTLPGCIEQAARRKGIKRGFCLLVGGIGSGRIVTGPANPRSRPIVPVLTALAGVHEIAGVGMIFPDEHGVARLHMHATLGRRGRAKTGCIRPGIGVWQIGEAIIVELVGSVSRRRKDPATGFELLRA